MCAQAALAPVGIELWSAPAWTCDAPPCPTDMAALGAAHATSRAHTVSANSLGDSDGSLPPLLHMNGSFFGTDEPLERPLPRPDHGRLRIHAQHRHATLLSRHFPAATPPPPRPTPNPTPPLP